MLAATALSLILGASTSHAKTQGEMASAPAGDRRRLATGVTVNLFGASTMCEPNIGCATPTLWFGRGTPVDNLDGWSVESRYTGQFENVTGYERLTPGWGLDYGRGQTTSILSPFWRANRSEDLSSFEDSFIAAWYGQQFNPKPYVLCGISRIFSDSEEWASKQDHPFIGAVLFGAECGSLTVGASSLFTFTAKLSAPTSCGGMPAWLDGGSGLCNRGWPTTRPGPSARLRRLHTLWDTASTHLNHHRHVQLHCSDGGGPGRTDEDVHARGEPRPWALPRPWFRVQS